MTTSQKTVIVTLDQQSSADFGFHFEDGKLVIDFCEGISIADGLSLFPEWVVAHMLEKSKEEKGS